MELKEEIKLLERKVELLKELKGLQECGKEIVYMPYPIYIYPTHPTYPTYGDRGPYTSPWCGAGHMGHATGGTSAEQLWAF